MKTMACVVSYAVTSVTLALGGLGVFLNACDSLLLCALVTNERERGAKIIVS